MSTSRGNKTYDTDFLSKKYCFSYNRRQQNLHNILKKNILDGHSLDESLLKPDHFIPC